MLKNTVLPKRILRKFQGSRHKVKNLFLKFKGPKCDSGTICDGESSGANQNSKKFNIDLKN